MEFKGTKGKWNLGDVTAKYKPYPETDKIKQKLIISGLDIPFDCISIGNNNAQVALIPTDTKNYEANAKLISYAPEMLELLKRCLEFVDDADYRPGAVFLSMDIEELIKNSTTI